MATSLISFADGVYVQKALRLVLWLLLAAMSLFVQTELASTQEVGGALKIIAVDGAEYPLVIVRVRLIDKSGNPQVGITNSEWLLRDAGRDVPPEDRELRELPDGEGLRVHFVLDAGLRVTNDDASFTNLDRARAVIRDFVNTTMIDQLDEVAVTVAQRDGARSIIDYSAEGQAVVDAVDGYRALPAIIPPDVGAGTPLPPPAAGSTSDPLKVLEDALDDMITHAASGGKPGALTLISPGLEVQSRSRLESMAARASEAAIPIQTVHTRNDVTRTDFEDLAALSGGQFSADLPPDEIYRHIASRRHQYQFEYRSNSPDSGTHQVELQYNSGDTAITDMAGYDVEVLRPVVVLESPAEGEIITRRASEHVEDTTTVRPTAQTVVARVTFPDSHQRSLLSAQLLFDGVAVGEPIRNPGLRVELPWDLRRFDSEGETVMTV